VNHYYAVHRTPKLPEATFVPAGILLAFIPLLTSAIKTRDPRLILSGLLGIGGLVVFVTVLIPNQDLLKTVVDGASVDAGVLEQARTTILMGHLGILAIFLVSVALQLRTLNAQLSAKKVA
jgi:hypothetical protein